MSYCYRPPPKLLDGERASATSKDALLDNDNSNSSATPDMQDARADCYATDNDVSDKKLSECSNLSCSNTSVECEANEKLADRLRRGAKGRPEEFGPDGTYRARDGEVYDGGTEAGNGAIRRKRNVKRNKRRKYGDKGKEAEVSGGNFSSLVELDLDWLFRDDNHRLQHRKGMEFYSFILIILINIYLFVPQVILHHHIIKKNIHISEHRT